MRYTEARLSKLSMEMVRDLDKETVDFYPNFDETLMQPAVLPSRFPNLLVNGSSGIAVGMATNIPPHNLGEVIDGVVCMLDNPDCTVDDLMQYIKGPVLSLIAVQGPLGPVDLFHGAGVLGLGAGALADKGGGPAPAGDLRRQGLPVRPKAPMVGKGPVALLAPPGGELDAGEVAVEATCPLLSQGRGHFIQHPGKDLRPVVRSQGPGI